MRQLVFLSVGAVAGVCARYGIGVWFADFAGGSDFPWATFVINVTGSLLLGFLMRYLTGVASTPAIRIMLTTGFCGAYTTMSTFSYEFINLLIARRFIVAATYMAGTIILAPLGCLAGFAAAEYILS